jgi:hypothetical protein
MIRSSASSKRSNAVNVFAARRRCRPHLGGVSSKRLAIQRSP